MNNVSRKKEYTPEKLLERVDIQPLHFCVDTIANNLNFEEEEIFRQTELTKKQLIEAQKISLQNQYNTNIQILNLFGLQNMINNITKNYEKEIQRLNEIENKKNTQEKQLKTGGNNDNKRVRG